MDSTGPLIGPPSFKLGHGKLVLSAIIFGVLSVGIFWYQFRQIQPGDVLPSWDQLRLSYLFLLLLCLPIETFAASFRIWVVSRVLHPGVSLITCIKAEVSNVAISMLTPSQTGGGPAQIYMLNRAGVNTGTALTISLLSFLGTMIALFLVGLYSLLVTGIAILRPLFYSAVWALISITAGMAVAVVWPELFRVPLAAMSRFYCRARRKDDLLREWWPQGETRTAPAADVLGPLAAKLLDIVYTYRRNVGRFFRSGKTSFAWVCLLSFVILFARALLAYLCLRFLAIDGSAFHHVIEVQMALIFLIFFAPTPGGAGLVEGASMTIMREIVPMGFAPAYHLLWRSLTLYLPAVAGLFCLSRAVAQHTTGTRPPTIQAFKTILHERDTKRQTLRREP
jgi:uncharacterized protein (TIRG00374 family)